MNKLERLLYDLKVEEQHKHLDIPFADMCECLDCGWSGKVSRCKSYEEYVGLMPEGEWWVGHICPECGDDAMEYFPSEESINEWNEVRK